MKLFRRAFGAALLSAVTVHTAHAAVALIEVDFEDGAVPGPAISGTQIESGGFLFSQTPATQDDIVVIKDPDAACPGTPCVDANATQWLAVYNDDQVAPTRPACVGWGIPTPVSACCGPTPCWARANTPPWCTPTACNSTAPRSTSPW